jgi:hypothetical protein
MANTDTKSARARSDSECCFHACTALCMLAHACCVFICVACIQVCVPAYMYVFFHTGEDVHMQKNIHNLCKVLTYE